MSFIKMIERYLDENVRDYFYKKLKTLKDLRKESGQFFNFTINRWYKDYNALPYFSSYMNFVYARILNPNNFKLIGKRYVYFHLKKDFIATSFLHYLSLLDSIYPTSNNFISKIGFLSLGREGWMFYQHFHSFLKELKKRFGVDVYSIFPRYAIPNLEGGSRLYLAPYISKRRMPVYKLTPIRLKKIRENLKNKEHIIVFEPSFVLG